MNSSLHITNGDSVADKLVTIFTEDAVLAWRDILYEGPVPNIELTELSKVRAKYLSDAGNGKFEHIAEQFTERDNLLLNHQHYQELVLWFEHDTYDQLQMLQILAWMHSQEVATDKIYLICINNYSGISPFLGLGQLTEDQLEKLYPSKKQVTPSQLQLAADLWRAFTSESVSNIQLMLNTNVEELRKLPYMYNALLRYLREFPSKFNGLSMTEQYILDSINSGNSEEEQIFKAMAAAEQDLFLGMGDTTFHKLLANLIDVKQPLIAAKLNRQHYYKLQLTELGKQILLGEQDWIAINGIDCWRGGAHLTKENCWRWA